MTTDRAGGIGLALVAAVVLEETWRSRLPLGSVATPGPAYVPVVLALALLGAAAVIAVQGGGVTLRAVGWSGSGHVVAIVAVCAFMALGLERLGYRLTMTIACAFLLAVVERKSVLAAVVFAAALAAGTHYLFDTLLRVPLPRGVLPF